VKRSQFLRPLGAPGQILPEVDVIIARATCTDLVVFVSMAGDVDLRPATPPARDMADSGVVSALIELTLGEILGIFTMLAAVVAIFYHRYRVLAAADFAIDPPPVPRSVVVAVKHAETFAYAQEPWYRRAAEYAQDVLTFLVPWLTYRMNFSVGRYRIKPATIEALLPWAQQQGYLQMHGKPDERLRHLLPYFSEQPVINDWQVAVILESLRRDHPQLRDMAWDRIAADPSLVAKLYSGYMGAGGDWDQWRSSLTPGPVARQRMELPG